MIKKKPAHGVERIDGKLYIWGSNAHLNALRRKEDENARIIGQSPWGARLDANQTAFLARDLVHVSQNTQKVLYEKLRAAEFVPIISDVPRGAKTWVYRQVDYVGEARIGAHLHTDDPPNADVGLEEFPFPVSHVTASYQYTRDDLEYAAFSRTPLPRWKAEAAAEIIARGLDKLIRLGNAPLGLTGFFNHVAVPVLTLTNGEWGTASAAEMIADVQQCEQAIISQSRDNHMGTRLILPTAYEGFIRSLRAGTASDMTVAEYVLKNARTLQAIERWIALDDATGADVGVSDPPQGILYTADPSYVHADIPVPFEEEPPQARNFGWVVPCRATFAGTTWRRPLSAVYIENLD